MNRQLGWLVGLGVLAGAGLGPRRAKRARTGAVSTLETVRLGGFNQQLIINGDRNDLPILLVLHGGPGVVESGFYRVFHRRIERSFLVVHWDQRGGGRSYKKAMTGGDIRVEKYLEDIAELIQLLKNRFGQEKVFLLGHSWGSVIGARYAARRPQDLHAYIGVAQIVSMSHGETASYQFALDSARANGDTEIASELERMGSPPYGASEFKTQRRYVKHYGGSFHGSFSVPLAIARILTLPEFNLVDLFLMKRGYKFAWPHVWSEITRDDLRADLTTFECPVHLFLGRHDHQVPSALGAEYFDLIHAPVKTLTWFEESAHSPSLEEPEKFDRTLVAIAESA